MAKGQTEIRYPCLRACGLARIPGLSGSGKGGKYSGEEVFGKINGRTGIIFFQNYWGLGNHIDLWNGRRLTALDSWLRIHARIGSFGMHSLGFGSDLKKAESVWFWALP